MLAVDHRAAAEDIEMVLPDLERSAAGPRANRMLIEGYWGATFHWIAFGCQQKHRKHKENHSKLFTYLRDIGEPAIGEKWQGLEQIRSGGWYGYHAAADDVLEARKRWEEIRTWALS
jgi:hypothetical protein